MASIPCKIVQIEGEGNIIATAITAPAKVKTGETVSGYATFKNVGNAADTQLCEVKADGNVVGSGSLTLVEGATGVVDYSFPAGGKGTITICPYPNPAI